MAITKDKLAYLAYAVIFIGLAFLLNPIREFALNDDWTHSLAIAQYVQAGEYYYPAWLSSFVYIPIIIGAAAGKIFGFSFSLLRLINLFFALGTVILFFKFLRHNRLPASVSFAAGMLLLFNPLFFNLSYTAMSDLPALFFIVAAIYFYDLGFSQKRYGLIFFASVICGLGFYIREVPIILLVGAGLHYLLLDDRKKIVKAAWLFGLPLGITVAVYLILGWIGALPVSAAAHFLPHGWSYLQTVSATFWHFLLLLSFFALPATAAIYAKKNNFTKKLSFWLILFLVSAAAVWAYGVGTTFPGLGNVINPFGLGPNQTVLMGSLPLWGNAAAYLAVNFVLAAALALNLSLFFAGIKSRCLTDNHYLYLWFFAILYLMIILVIRTFDRYLLLLMPVVLTAFSLLLNKYAWSKIVFFLALLPLALYSTIGTYNYLAWNQARWHLAQSLVSDGIPLADIEAGYEWDGWHLYREASITPLGDYTPNWAPWYIKDLFPGHGLKYIIAFSSLGGYETVKKEKVQGLLSNIDFIYINEIRPGSLK